MADTMLNKIRKLLAKAEDPACTTAEAEALTSKAAELIAKYGVDRALLAAAAPETDTVGDLVIDMPAPYAVDKCSMLAGVADALRCQSVRREARTATSRGRGFAMHLFGFASDLERVDLLFTSLLVQAGQALAAAPLPSLESPAAYRRSWLAGYTIAIVARLRAAEKQAAEAADAPSSAGRSVALVLADRSGEVTRAVAEAYPNLHFAPPRKLAGSGRYHGYAAGQRADLGGTRLARSSSRAVAGSR